MTVSVGGHLLQWLLAEWTAEVVVQAPLYAVFTEGVTTGGSDWLKEQPSKDRVKTLVLFKPAQLRKDIHDIYSVSGECLYIGFM